MEKEIAEILKKHGFSLEEGIYMFDREVVEQLKRSREQQGYLLPVVKDQEGIIISGRHRLAADPNWPVQTLEVKDELDRELKILHYNVQRRLSKKEAAGRLTRIAELLEKRGVPVADICPQLCKLVPYSERHVRRLLPDRYKREEMKREKPTVECEFHDYIMALAKVVRESLPEAVSCVECPIRDICSEYKKAIFELTHEIEQA